MDSLFVKYAVNKTDFEVQMMDNRICVPGKGWKGITEEEIRHPDIVYALRKEWIELVDKEPTSKAKPERKKIKTINADDPGYSGEKDLVKVSKIGA